MFSRPWLRSPGIATCLGAAALLCSLASPLVADQARIPVAGPVLIDQPGHYVVTRDFSVPTLAFGVEIVAADVVLDLNGHTITGLGTSHAVVVVSATKVTIRNGRIYGGGQAIFHASATGRVRFRVENVEIKDSALTAIRSDATEHVEIVDCRIDAPAAGSGIRVEGDSGPFGGQISGNVVLGSPLAGITVHGLSGGEIRDSVVVDVSSVGSSAGLVLSADPTWNAGRNLVAGNTIHGSGWLGISIDADTSNNVVRNNVVTDSGSTGIQVFSPGNSIVGNLVAGNAANGINVLGTHGRIVGNVVRNNGVTGIVCSGQFALVESNLAVGNANAGLSFLGSNHVYRDNMLRGNDMLPVLGAALATDAGGNIQ